MGIQQALLREIAAFCAARGIAVTTFGKYAARDTRLVEKLRTGTVTVKTIEKARAYIAAEQGKAQETSREN